MLKVLGGARQTPPLREGVMLSASVGVRHGQWARPRSAVTVSPTAPGLSPLTGFSRSGTPIHNDRLRSAFLMRHFSQKACRGLEADATILSDKVAHTPHRRPWPLREGPRPLHVNGICRAMAVLPSAQVRTLRLTPLRHNPVIPENLSTHLSPVVDNSL